MHTDVAAGGGAFQMIDCKSLVWTHWGRGGLGAAATLSPSGTTRLSLLFRIIDSAAAAADSGGLLQSLLRNRAGCSRCSNCMQLGGCCVATSPHFKGNFLIIYIYMDCLLIRQQGCKYRRRARHIRIILGFTRTDM
jgi:hypothetical protein